MTAVDVNGDGKPDLIVANTYDNTVSVLLNTTAPGATTPSFSPQQTFATGSYPYSVAAADLNGDGKPDLLVTNGSDGTVSVLLNATAPGATTPSFSPQQTFATDGFPRSVTAADVNGDGKPDLIVANTWSGTVSVLLNTTPAPATTFDGNSFATQQTFATGSGTFFVTAADLNGDGKLDLIVANIYDSTVSVLLNTTAPGATTPSFATQQTFAVGSNPRSVTVADVNGDGKLDLIVTNGSDGTASVLLNTTTAGATTPSFSPQQTFATGNYPFSATAADVNGDGKPDLIVANANDGTVSVLLNTTAPGAATPSFAPQQTFATGNEPNSVTAAYVNGDGKPDLIVTNTYDSTVSVLLNTTAPGATTPSFSPQQTFAMGSNPQSVTAADLNGDGKPDLIVANWAHGSGNTVSVLLNTTAPGATTPSFSPQQTFTTGSGSGSVTAADLNGDGKPDLIVANASATTVSVLLNTTAPGATTPSFSPQQTFAVGGYPYSVTAADLNGDGMPDLIVTNLYDKTVSVLLNTLYATTASGSPATGTIHYNIPTTTIFVPASLSFGNFPVGDTVTKNLTVRNTGAHPLYIYNVTSNDPEFAATGATSCPSGGLAHLATCTIAIGFTPSALGPHSATLSITDNTATSPQHVALSGTGTVDMTTSTTTVNWPNVKFGIPVTKSFSVTNHQNIAVPITKNITGLNAADFSVSGGTCGSTIAAKTTCSIAVKFAAGALGSESATIAIIDGPDPQSPHNVSLFVPGTIPATVTPLSITYGTITETSAQIKNVTVTNKSPFTISVGSVVGGADPADFSVVGGCGPTLAGNSSCQIAVMFQPTDVGTRSGTLAVSIGQDPASPHNVSLSGTGS